MKKLMSLCLSFVLILGTFSISDSVHAAKRKNKNYKRGVTKVKRGKRVRKGKKFRPRVQKFRNQEPKECSSLRRRIVYGADNCVRAKTQQQKEQHCNGCLDGKNAVNEAQSKGCNLNYVQAQITDISENFENLCGEFLDSQVSTPAQTQHEMGF